MKRSSKKGCHGYAIVALRRLYAIRRVLSSFRTEHVQRAAEWVSPAIAHQRHQAGRSLAEVDRHTGRCELAQGTVRPALLQSCFQAANMVRTCASGVDRVSFRSSSRTRALKLSKDAFWVGSLSDTHIAGRPRRAMMTSSSRTTRRPGSEISATSARHSHG